jgi:uncharacterized protein YgbK (DUF1537 family)
MIGVIADDLTGAAEIGAVGLRHGATAEIILAGATNSLAASDQPTADLLCVDTDSRLCTPDEAARRAQAAAVWLKTLGARWIYKKVDSVLRGQVTAEIEAVMTETGSQLTFLVPANPGLGREIRDGRYYVRGKPVHETEFAFDAAYPRTSSFVLEMISPPRNQTLRACVIGDAPPISGIVIGEAESGEHLDHWARAGDGKALRAGGAEFFAASLRADGCKPVAAPTRARGPQPIRTVRELFVCGSNSNSAHDFHASSEAAGIPVFGLPAQAATAGLLTDPQHAELVRQAVNAYESKTRVVLRVGLERVADPVNAARLSSCVVRVAQGVLGKIAVDRVYAEGGTTAVELARTLGWGRLRVLHELAPGVAALGLSGRMPAELTIKPGSYTWPADVVTGK